MVWVPCFHPVKGWKSAGGQFVFNQAQSAGVALTIPCGQCMGCRLERSRQWAVRMMHEASLYRENCFITLTYSPEFLPPYGSLVKSDFQKFMKRLRKSIAPRTVRFFHAGEYGEALGRPHYHACLFGFDFDDREPFTMRGDHRVCRSKLLERLWPYGISEVGSLTFESAAYVARYVTKKVTGGAAVDHYGVVDGVTGEVVQLEPEYATMSRRPGIGAEWYSRYRKEVYPSDEVVVRGRSMRPPRAYDVRLESEDPEVFCRVKRARRMARDFKNSTESRLAVREEVLAAKQRVSSPRPLEAGQ